MTAIGRWTFTVCHRRSPRYRRHSEVLCIVTIHLTRLRITEFDVLRQTSAGVRRLSGGQRSDEVTASTYIHRAPSRHCHRGLGSCHSPQQQCKDADVEKYSDAERHEERRRR